MWQNSLDKDSWEDFTFQNSHPVDDAPPLDPIGPSCSNSTSALPPDPPRPAWTWDDQSAMLPSPVCALSPRRSSRHKVLATRLVPKWTSMSYHNPPSLLFTGIVLAKGITNQSGAMLQAQCLATIRLVNYKNGFLLGSTSHQWHPRQKQHWILTYPLWRNLSLDPVLRKSGQPWTQKSAVLKANVHGKSFWEAACWLELRSSLAHGNSELSVLLQESSANSNPDGAAAEISRHGKEPPTVC